MAEATIKTDAPVNIKLLLTFTAIARESDVTKLRVLIGGLEKQFAEYTDIVLELINCEPEVIAGALIHKWPKVAPLMAKPEALDVIRKIQIYFKEKENAG